MKNFCYLIVAVMLFAVGCGESFDDSKIWDKLDNHESRISQLEELCKQMNTNISSLQTIVNALQENDYITNVSPVRKDGDIIGYTITFAHSDTITIYNGTDGEDGYTPQIGVMKDVDDIYYWTIDGEWLLDGKGNKIQAIGENGEDGENGKDSITPRLKIENDYWHVSYDEGVTWEQLGKATGNNGLNGADGDNIFISVTQDEESVYFNLADGTMITLSKHDKENIQFEDLRVKVICCKNWDTNNDFQLSYSEAASVEDIGTVFSGNTEIIAFEELKYFTGIKTIPVGAFDGCSSLCTISLPNNIIQIEENAFHNCSSLYAIVFPENITHIGTKSFSGCSNIATIKMPTSLLSIGEWAFMSCPSIDVYISDISAWCKVKFGNHSSQPLCKGRLFIDNKLVTDLTFPNDVESISPYAFYCCESLVSVTINNNTETIGLSAFGGCVNIANVVFGENLLSIEKEAFQGCDNITSLVLNDKITYIGYRTFWNCNNLGNVEFGNSKISIDGEAFQGCDKLSSVTIGTGLTLLGYSAFDNCTALSRVYCKTVVPSKISYDPIYDNDVWSAFYGTSTYLKIFVPYTNIDDYKSAKGWKQYKDKIFGYDFEKEIEW